MRLKLPVCLILIFAICAWGAFCLLNDEDDARDLFCSGIFACGCGAYLFYNPDNGIRLYGFSEDISPHKSITSYLAQHEKSPPELS